MYSLYVHTSPSGKRYVGITGINPNRRWQNGRGYNKCPAFRNAIEKYGWDNIRHDIIMSGLTKEEAEQFEKLFITAFQTQNPEYGYNCESGGNIGKEVSAESRRKNSESHKGENNYMYGRHHTEDARKKMSDIQKHLCVNRPRSKECREKISNSLKKSVINLDTGEVFSSVKEASVKSGVCYSCISEVLRGHNKTAGGYRWAYNSG